MKLGRDFFRRFTPSLLAFCIHTPLILSGLPFGSFDAYTHIFLADHYRRAWFNLVEPKWFGGFSVASYPPLVHQLIAVISRPVSALASLGRGTAAEIRFTGEAIAYGLVLLAVLVALPMAVERFSRIFVPARAARTAAWLAVGLPSVYLTAYAFGQLPTLAATTVLLWTLSEVWEFVQTGHARHWLMAVLWAGVTAALHHAVILFAVIVGGAVLVRALMMPTSDRWQSAVRFSLWAGAAGGIGILVAWPFLAWSRSYVAQVPIDHLSRHNVVTEWLASYYFLWPMYGPLLLALPVLLVRFVRHLIRRLHSQSFFQHLRSSSLLGAATFLFLLGLGGATPLPPLLFGSYWEWLTYDRFSLWAGLMLLPLAGLVWHVFRRRRWMLILMVAQVFFCFYAAVASAWVQAQPPQVDVARLARWLNDNARGGERYLTLGFGDQLAKLSTLTEARTLDGTYFTARAIPVLQRSGIATLDGARWNQKGAWGIRQFLVISHHWGVRWVLSRDPAFEPVLRSSGYRLWGTIAPSVRVWRNSSAWVRTEFAAPVQNDPVAAAWWGVAPITVLLLATVTAIAIRYPHLSSLFIVSLFIVIWPFWYYLPVWMKTYAGVYFTYTSIVFLAADAIALTLVVFAVASAIQTRTVSISVNNNLWPLELLALLIVFATLSIPNAVDPTLAVVFVLHLLTVIVIGWAASKAAPQMGWRGLAMALSVAVVIQSAVAVIEVAVQHTGWLDSLGLPWPGWLEAQTRGASVVELANGLRWLRAYGTLPHPNTLGAFLAVSLTGPLMGYVQTGKARWLFPILLGAAALLLTFSRAAWLAGAVMLLGAVVLLPTASRRRALTATISCLLVIGVLVIALGPLVLVRVSASSDSPREVSSTLERLGLAQIALDFIRERPLFGVGAGGFSVAMVADGAPIAEPVHNLPLLVASETGLGGGAAALGLGAWLVVRAWRRRGWGVGDSVLAAGIVGLIVFAQFDHFVWSLSAGRVWAAVMIGLWLGWPVDVATERALKP